MVNLSAKKRLPPSGDAMSKGNSKRAGGRKKGLPENVRHARVSFRVTEREKEQIEANALQTIGTVGEFTRNVALGYPISSRLDCAVIRDLIKKGGDLGRLGGLLKQNLSRGHSPAQAAEIKKLLRDIDEAQSEMRELIHRARQEI